MYCQRRRKTKEELQQEEQFARDVIDAYNQIFNGLLPQAEYDKDLRGRIIRFRKDYLKDKSINGFIAFEEFKNTASDFYFGYGFTATLDFLLKPKTLRDIRELVPYSNGTVSRDATGEQINGFTPARPDLKQRIQGSKRLNHSAGINRCKQRITDRREYQRRCKQLRPARENRF
ncbi:hypothetical protein ACLB1S_22170 [Escherichia coli]